MSTIEEFTENVDLETRHLNDDLIVTRNSITIAQPLHLLRHDAVNLYSQFIKY